MASALRSSRGALAGWLFADLALVLAFVFLDSTAQGDAGQVRETTTTTTTTTTTPSAESTTTIDPTIGVSPQPIEFQVVANKLTSAETLVERVNRALDAQLVARGLSKDTKFLVVIIRGGSRDNPSGASFGRDVANAVQQKLIESWSRVVPNQTYFQPMGTNVVDQGIVELALFPLID